MWLAPAFSYIILLTGLVQIATSLMFYWTDARNLQSRTMYARILTIVLVVDAFILHCPWTELDRGFGKEI